MKTSVTHIHLKQNTRISIYIDYIDGEYIHTWRERERTVDTNAHMHGHRYIQNRIKYTHKYTNRNGETENLLLVKA